eukprot:TRINITY_DN6714_c0_g1_i10.p1 TRINITY_DN6714_c0_g1~~TRINITY_DN6714_c0_g1_i10.p1  ORF type:complete len:137 (-),score=8.07 TRINITY_DN6714_c0_g1_i10:311-721(-)
MDDRCPHNTIQLATIKSKGSILQRYQVTIFPHLELSMPDMTLHRPQLLDHGCIYICMFGQQGYAKSVGHPLYNTCCLIDQFTKNTLTCRSIKLAKLTNKQMQEPGGLETEPLKCTRSTLDPFKAAKMYSKELQMES